MRKAKPFDISKMMVWKAYRRVKASGGAAGIDGQSISDFERDLKRNLYKIWNRLSSGTYFPPPVRTVLIPKATGGTRQLGIPTVGDRIAQTVVKLCLEPMVEPTFHPDSYGYRPGKSAHDAIETCRKRCWRYDWVIDLDIKGFFDNLDHALIMRAVKKHTTEPWVLLYIERWLKAPIQQEDGLQVDRDRGTPQGSVISPLLANIFLHHAFAKWMQATFPRMPFEYYADDVVVHCQTAREAEHVRSAIAKRLEQCRLEAHPDKTRIVYCKDANRSGAHAYERFDFLGFTFRPRSAVNQRTGKRFASFLPAISDKAAKAIRREVRSWHLGRRSDKSLEDLARQVNPCARGWINYYGRFYKSAMVPTLWCIEYHLTRWVIRKFKRLRSFSRARMWLDKVACREPQLFAHWSGGLRSG